VSLVGLLRNGDATELSLVGCEGGVGVGLILGGETTLTLATVQSVGTALRWEAAALKRELKRGGIVQRMHGSKPCLNCSENAYVQYTT
jgi:hypothetical protein